MERRAAGVRPDGVTIASEGIGRAWPAGRAGSGGEAWGGKGWRTGGGGRHNANVPGEWTKRGAAMIVADLTNLRLGVLAVGDEIRIPDLAIDVAGDDAEGLFVKTPFGVSCWLRLR